MYIVLVGNVVDGITPFGSWENQESAIEWAAETDCDWNVVEVENVNGDWIEMSHPNDTEEEG